MPQLRVTAVITTYHREWKMLLRSIESVLRQTVPVFELLLIDDNGLGTAYQKQNQEQAAKYPQIHYLAMEKNSGVSAARNRAIEAAKGDVLGYLDDDDEWCPDKIERLLPLFAKGENTALVFGTGQVFEKRTGKRHYNWQWEVFKPEPTYQDMLYTDYVGSASAPLIRVEALRELGGFRQQPAVEDYELWIRIAQHYALRGTRDVVFWKYNETEEHVSGSLRRVGQGFRCIYRLYREDYQACPRARTAILWNICRTGVRSLDLTVVPFVFAWLWSRIDSEKRG